MSRSGSDNSNGNESSRRKFLVASGSSGLALGMAGCQGLFGGGGNGNGNGDGNGTGNGPGNGSDGEPEGEPVRELDYVSVAQDQHPIRYQWTQMHSEALEELGFQINFMSPPVNEYLSIGFDNREHDMYVLRWGDGWDPDRVMNDFFSESTLPSGGGNVSQYQDEEFQEMLMEQRQAVDEDARQEIIYEMQKKVIEDEHIISPAFIQTRPMPYNTNTVANTTTQPENGLASVWNMLSVEDNDDGTLVYGQPEPLSHLNPLNVTSRAERDIIRIIYDKLMRVPADGGTPEPWAAESVEWPDDTTVEVTLREGLTWHDGESLTAEDVRFSYEYGGEHSSTIGGLLEPIDDITVENDLTVTFNLSEPYAPFETRVLAGRNVSLIPQHIWEDIPDSIDAESAVEWSNTDDPIGSGPFQVEDFTLDEETNLTAFSDHFNPPNVDEATRLQFSDTRSAVAAAEDGTLDMLAYGVNPNDVSELEGQNHLDIASPQMTSTHYLTYNLERDLFQQEAVRRAMGYALPKEEANSVALSGQGEVIHTCISPALNFWHNPDVEEMNQDMDQAEQLLADAGFEWDSDGRIHHPAE